MSERFYESSPWRFVVTNLSGVLLTFLDRLAFDRKVTRTLNAPLSMEGRVPSANPEVNLLAVGDPLLSEGNRLLFGLRREIVSPGVEEYVCRAGTIILKVDDRGDANSGYSTFEAFDPWAFANLRPVVNSLGAFPGENGISYGATMGSAIVQALAQQSVAAHGSLRLDVTTGTFETTDLIDINFQQGISLGEAWDQLVETGTLDIVIDPIYDPFVRPGIVGVLNVYERAGSIQPAAGFAWDLPGRSAIIFDRSIDGTARVNRARYHIGQGGPPATVSIDTISSTKFGQYWEQKFFPGTEELQAVSDFAETQVRLRKDGLIGYRISPAPERSPVPFLDYDIGDTVPIYASSNLRDPVSDYMRVISIPLVLGNDQMEAVQGLELSEESVEIPS